jgi:hypothetical protein
MEKYLIILLLKYAQVQLPKYYYDGHTTRTGLNAEQRNVPKF